MASITTRFQEDEFEAPERDGLGEVVIEAGLPRAHPVVRLNPAREGHEKEALQRRLGPQTACRLVAVESRQAEVEDRDVRTQTPRRVDGGRAVVRDVRLVARESQQFG